MMKQLKVVTAGEAATSVAIALPATKLAAQTAAPRAMTLMVLVLVLLLLLVVSMCFSALMVPVARCLSSTAANLAQGWSKVDAA